ncbi:DUF438 domain-containing protein [Sporosarcina pasteurii]|uniref:Uncharacterized conserved protein n=1 Tax=Sporosarcina pasteurii TaxID=1474 RepID=A0A380CH06_SPOPA|nr:DUF438 domain-containing protein [Sporosarcina pasteurii]MDS9473183.1 DUF438 domain-containing protein [Sporosarcina pasteurii]QBQ06918.1 DUF438 domain-containing protein [Sporosarcina pasteurii]SUJ19479.1 Uncharacterized conserved protein [Sporosarcina pasteurii]
MLNMQFDIKRMSALKEILLYIRDGGSLEAFQIHYEQHFNDVRPLDLLLMQLELINGDYGVTMEDIKKFSSMHAQLSSQSLNEKDILPANHPVQIFKAENTAFQVVLNQIQQLLQLLEEDSDQAIGDELTEHIFHLGEFHNHYNRKEKLFFPIMERYGHIAPARTVWRKDDRIRALYQALKKQIVRVPLDVERVRMRYTAFEKEFKEMIFQEEAIILPILQKVFSEADWLAVANESDAFGYALIDGPEEKCAPTFEEQTNDTPPAENLVMGGGGYLTTKEAQLILNNLPLEITFVDKNDLFKYFNDITDASEMMLVRTPSSIGRNVANCHPPKSLMKVMTIIRDLKTGRRTSESMWFKMKGKYIHITYKSLFNDKGEFLGILEYVQDIQPFFELPSEVKMGLSELEK